MNQINESPPDKNDADPPAPPKPDPWDPIMSAASHYLTDLECTREMFTLVAPILEANDGDRQRRIEALCEPIKDEAKRRKGYAFKSLSDIREFIKHNSRMRRGDVMFRRNTIVGMISQFDDFLMGIIKVSFTENPEWLKNADKKLSYKEILETVSIEDLKRDLIVREVNQLMRDSHHAQIAFLDSRLKLGIEENFEGWPTFLEMTERRNLFVHNGGCVNQIYIGNARKYGFPLNPKYKDGTALTVGDDYIDRAIDCLYELTVRISQATARRLFPECAEEADKSLNNQTVDLMSDERWGLAERIFAYALKIPDRLRSGTEYKYYSLINLCIALKFSGKDFADTLKSVDWEPMHPKYHFAVAVLEDRYDEAAELMKSEAVLKAIPKDDFLNWPLLKAFRETPQFTQAFDELFSLDDKEKLLEKAREQIDAEHDVAVQPSAAEELFSDGNEKTISGSEVRFS
jgi:hypothetical protein